MRRLPFLMFTLLAFLVLNPNSSFPYENEIKSMSSNMAKTLAESGKKAVAVVDFVDLQANVTELGRFLAEEFSVSLAGSDKGFEVIDRTHLKSILAEHKLSATGIIDPQTARKLGEVAGADALVTGTITPFGDSIRLSVKVLDTSTARIIGASSADIPKTKAIEELLARGVEASQSAMQEPPFPPVSSYPTIVAKSKTTRPITVTVQSVMVRKDGVLVALEFSNSSGDTLDLFRRQNAAEPQLSDDKGNTFKYETGIPRYLGERNPDTVVGIILNPNSSNEAVLMFRHPEKLDISKIGSVFAFSVTYESFGHGGYAWKWNGIYSASFTGLNAMKPK